MAQFKERDRVFHVGWKEIGTVLGVWENGLTMRVFFPTMGEKLADRNNLILVDDILKAFSPAFIAERAGIPIAEMGVPEPSWTTDRAILLASLRYPELRDLLVQIRKAEYEQKLADYRMGKSKPKEIPLSEIQEKVKENLVPEEPKRHEATYGGSSYLSGADHQTLRFSAPPNALDPRCTYRLPENKMDAKDEEMKNLGLAIQSVVDDAVASGEAYEKKVKEFIRKRIYAPALADTLLNDLPKFELHSFGWLKSQEKPAFLRKIMDKPWA